MTGRKTGRRRLFRLAVLTCSILVGLLAGEGLVRLSGRAPRLKQLELDGADSVYRRSTNPILGFELKSGYRNDRADYSRTYPSTNAHGQRDLERSLAKPAQTRRILLLGDSVVEGHGIGDMDDTLSRRLESLLAADGTEVLNFGVSGYCTRAEVELLAVKGLAFDPDVVILVFVSNDFDNFNREAFELEQIATRPPIVEALVARSHLFRMLSTRFDLFGLGADADPVGWNRRAMGDNNVVDGFRLLRRLADEHRFLPLVAVWPVFDDRRVLDAHVMPDGDDLVVERLAAAEGLPTVRLSRFFEDDRASREAGANPRLLYTIGDGLHPSPEGNRVAARALRAALAAASPSAPPRAGPQDDVAAGLARSLGTTRPGYAHVHNNNGVSLQQAGRLEQAVEAFRLALESDPDFVAARNNLANALLRQGKLEEALVLYRGALELEPDQPDVHYNIGLVLEHQGHREQALQHFHHALRLRPGFSRAREKLALAESDE